MSEQTKGNVHVFGAGLFGFVAVVGAAGLALKLGGGGAHAPAAATAAAPIEAGILSLPSPAASAPAHLPRPASPQPLLGAHDEAFVEENAAAPAHAQHAAAAPAAGAAGSAPSSLQALGAPKHHGKGESVSSATAEVKKFSTPGPQAPQAPAPAAKPVPRLKLDASRNSVASTVHYGVTSRAELMGKAAGPVYNFKGAKPAGAGRTAELAAEANSKIDDLEKQLESNTTLTEEQKAAIRQKLGTKRQP
jgi:hypothetical protein